ncbi:MAG: hypothetical protein ACR2P4_06165 [Gammaproteobacteria bacterium]
MPPPPSLPQKRESNGAKAAVWQKWEITHGGLCRIAAIGLPMV